MSKFQPDENTFGTNKPSSINDDKQLLCGTPWMNQSKNVCQREPFLQRRQQLHNNDKLLIPNKTQT